MKITKPFIGIIAFVLVLLTMPIGHGLMVLMEKYLGHAHVFEAAMGLGFLGVVLLLWGLIVKKQTGATILGLFAGLFVWTGWIEFAFVYYAHRYNIPPLMANGEIATKPEYLIIPSSIGFWALFMLYYFFGTKTGCTFFTWFQKRLKITNPKEMKPVVRNVAMTTFMEFNVLVWTSYLLLLLIYDFAGDQSLLTHFVAYGALIWGVYLIIQLLKKTQMGYAIRYAIPTVVIFWTYVEVMGRWGVLKEIWVEPMKYSTEMISFVVAMIILLLIILFEDKRRKRKEA